MTPLGREWVRKAEFDRRAAVTLRSRRPVVHNVVCFLCQQYAEKYLKALLHESGQPVRRTNDCEAIVLRLTAFDPTIGQFIPAAAGLNRFAVDPRYPGYQPTAAESRSAWNAAESIRAEVRRRLGLRPRP